MLRVHHKGLLGLRGPKVPKTEGSPDVHPYLELLLGPYPLQGHGSKVILHPALTPWWIHCDGVCESVHSQSSKEAFLCLFILI